jgi:hypothetical protein
MHIRTRIAHEYCLSWGESVVLVKRMCNTIIVIWFLTRAIVWGVTGINAMGGGMIGAAASHWNMVTEKLSLTAAELRARDARSVEHAMFAFVDITRPLPSSLEESAYVTQPPAAKLLINGVQVEVIHGLRPVDPARVDAVEEATWRQLPFDAVQRVEVIKTAQRQLIQGTVDPRPIVINIMTVVNGRSLLAPERTAADAQESPPYEAIVWLLLALFNAALGLALLGYRRWARWMAVIHLGVEVGRAGVGIAEQATLADPAWFAMNCVVLLALLLLRTEYRRYAGAY